MDDDFEETDDEKPWTEYRVWMHSRPAVGRTFYDGKVDVWAQDDVQAQKKAIDRAYETHRHRDWVVEKIETLRTR